MNGLTSASLLLLLLLLSVVSDLSFGFVAFSSSSSSSRRQRFTTNKATTTTITTTLETSNDEFRTWLRSELEHVPNRDTYSDVYEDSIEAIIRWRKRYHGNPKVWKRIFKKDRVVKELIESVPIIQSVKDIIMKEESSLSNNNNNTATDTTTEEEKYTIVDLCSGKGYLSMLLSEILPPEKVRKFVLVDKAWAIASPETKELKPHHMNWDHIYGEVVDVDTSSNQTYFTTWPIPLYTSKQDLKQSCNARQMKKHFFDKTPGPIILLAVHLCGTLSIKAVDMFNQHDQVHFLALKPCCLPKMVYAKRKEVFQIGTHSFPSEEVCSNGYFQGKKWNGPPRWHLEPKFQKWSHHLFQGIDLGTATSIIVQDDDDDDKSLVLQHQSPYGIKAKKEIVIQVDGGFQNTFLFAKRTKAVSRP